MSVADESPQSPATVSIGGVGEGSINTTMGDQEPLVNNQDPNHYPLPIVPALYGKLLLLIVLIAGAFLLPDLYVDGGKTDSFSGLQYLHVVIWAFITVLTWYVKAEHKKSRIQGYHDFYNATRHLHRITFYILSGGNVLLVILGSLVKDYCMGDSVSQCSVNLPLSSVNYQQIFFILEVIMAIPFVIKHIVRVVQFNSAELPPDTLAEDLSYRFTRPDSYVGSRGPSNLEWVLERQADLLQVLRHRNAILSQQVYALTHAQINPA